MFQIRLTSFEESHERTVYITFPHLDMNLDEMIATPLLLQVAKNSIIELYLTVLFLLELIFGDYDLISLCEMKELCRTLRISPVYCSWVCGEGMGIGRGIQGLVALTGRTCWQEISALCQLLDRIEAVHHED